MAIFEQDGFCTPEAYHAGMAYLISPEDLQADAKYLFMGSFAKGSPLRRAIRMNTIILGSQQVGDERYQVSFQALAPTATGDAPMTIIANFADGYLVDTKPGIVSAGMVDLSAGYFKDLSAGHGIQAGHLAVVNNVATELQIPGMRQLVGLAS